MKWIYLSPHLDDAVLSCGGLIWEQARSGDSVTVLTIFAGDPPEGELSPFAALLHQVWQTGRDAVELRRREDREACRRVGAKYEHLDFPDCIYRSGRFDDTDEKVFLYTSSEALFGEISPLDTPVLEAVTKQLRSFVAPDAQLVSPLAIGNHVDHQIVRKAAERLGVRLYYYADYPYIMDSFSALDDLKQEGWNYEQITLPEDGIAAWVNAVAAYESQISSFWVSLADMEQKLRDYYKKLDGICLWQSGKTP